MKHANTMSTITVDLTIKVKTKFISSNAEKTKWIHLTDVGNFHRVRPLVLTLREPCVFVLWLRVNFWRNRFDFLRGSGALRVRSHYTGSWPWEGCYVVFWKGSQSRVPPIHGRIMLGRVVNQVMLVVLCQVMCLQVSALSWVQVVGVVYLDSLAQVQTSSQVKIS